MQRVSIMNGIYISENVFVGRCTILSCKNGDISEQEKPSYGIKVGKNCWLGAGSKVFDGVSIGEDTIIGAGAVVSRDIPPFSVATGIPARIAKSRN